MVVIFSIARINAMDPKARFFLHVLVSVIHSLGCILNLQRKEKKTKRTLELVMNILDMWFVE